MILLKTAFMVMTGRLRTVGWVMARWCGGCRGVVALDYLGAVTFLGEQFLLGQQVVGEDPVQLSDLVDLLEFRREAIEECVSDYRGRGPLEAAIA